MLNTTSSKAAVRLASKCNNSNNKFTVTNDTVLHLFVRMKVSKISKNNSFEW